MFNRLIGSGNVLWLKYNSSTMVESRNELSFMHRDNSMFVLIVNGAKELERDGIYRDLVKLILKAHLVQNVSDDCKTRDHVIVTYNSKLSRDTVTRIIKSRRYSSQTKLAAILSIMKLAPDMSFEDAEKLMQTQVRPDEIKNMHFNRNFSFLYPDFAIRTLDPLEHNNVTLSKNEYERFLSLCSFIAHSNTDETFSQYFSRVDYGELHPIRSKESSDRLNILFERIRRGHTVDEGMWSEISETFKDSTSEELVRFYDLYEDTNPVFHRFLLKRLTENEMNCETWTKVHPHITDLYSVYPYFDDVREISIYLTIGEHHDLLKNLATNLEKRFLKPYIVNGGKHLFPVLAYYYLLGGFERVHELLLFLESNVEYSTWALARAEALSMEAHEQKAKTLMRAVGPDLKDYPLAWALQISSSEHPDDIGSQLVR